MNEKLMYVIAGCLMISGGAMAFKMITDQNDESEELETSQSNGDASSLLDATPESSNVKAKIELPGGLKFGMTSAEVLSKNFCDLKKVDGTNFKKSDTFLLQCVSTTQPPFPYKSKQFLLNVLPQLTFVNDRLRRISFGMGLGVVDFVPLIEGGTQILGPLHQGTDMDALRKFDAGILPSVAVAWIDGPNVVVIKILKVPDGTAVTDVLIAPKDFNADKELQ